MFKMLACSVQKALPLKVNHFHINCISRGKEMQPEKGAIPDDFFCSILLEIMVELAKRMQHSVKHWHLWRYAVVKI
jgi:hypothetical protein